MNGIPGVPSLVNLDGAFDKLFKLALIGGGAFALRYAYRKYQENKTSDAAGGDLNIQAAIEIHQAIDGAGTAEEVLYTIAGRITDWAAVSKAYRNKYHNDMLEDIKSDLSPENFAKFMNIYNLSKKDPKTGALVNSKNTIEPGLWVYIERDANVRKTPKVITKAQAAQNLVTKLKADNIIGLASAGKYVGITTGVYALDANTDESVLFLEVKIGVVDDKGKHELVTAWIASSQLRTEKKEKGFSPGAKLTFFTKKKYTDALGAIGANSNFKKELLLKGKMTAILDLEGNLKGYAYGKDLILGFKDAEYSDKNNKRFFIFNNIQGLTRMIEVDSVKERSVA